MPLSLAAAAATATDPLSLLLNYGPVGIMLMLIAVGYIVPKPTHAAVLKERDEARAALAVAQAALLARQDTLVPRSDYQALHDELAKLRAKMEDQMIPGVFRATETLSQTMAVLSRMAERAPI